jgi:hypothetical protein
MECRDKRDVKVVAVCGLQAASERRMRMDKIEIDLFYCCLYLLSSMGTPVLYCPRAGNF